jgi:peptidyl-prolyl cis-trans isomerase B (cyclophilin B)
VLRYLTTLLALVALLAVSGCGDDDSDSAGNGSDTAPAAAATTPADTETAETDTTAATETSAADTPPRTKCVKVEEAPFPKEDGGQTPPKGKLDPARTYDIAFRTSCGDFTVRLDVEGAPNTTASLASLARKGFFDDTTFHRIVPGFVIQGGDPTGAGSGGPGYKTVDVPPADAKYPLGTVAMGKTGPEPKGTSGSQFFVVTGKKVPLTADYAIVGKVVDGMDTVMRIEELGDPAGGGTPSRPIVIEKATLRAT